MLSKKGSSYIFLSVCMLSVLVVGLYHSNCESPDEHFILKEHDGALAIFSDDGTLIRDIPDTNLNAIPEEDKEKLKQGINAFSEEELASLIEDFLC